MNMYFPGVGYAQAAQPGQYTNPVPQTVGQMMQQAMAAQRTAVNQQHANENQPRTYQQQIQGILMQMGIGQDPSSVPSSSSTSPATSSSATGNSNPSAAAATAGSSSSHRSTYHDSQDRTPTPRPAWINAPGDMVTFNVVEADGTKTPFIVHKAFFCHESPMFNAAFNGGFSEGDTQAMEVRDTTREVFALLIEWVYTKRVDTRFEEEDRQNLPNQHLSYLHGSALDLYVEESAALALVHTKNLLHIWLLGDRFLMPQLQNDAIDAIEDLRFFHNGIPGAMCREVYEQTASEFIIRKYLATTTYMRLGPGFSDDAAEFPHEMLIDIVNTFKTQRSEACYRYYAFTKKGMERFYKEFCGGTSFLFQVDPADTGVLYPAHYQWEKLWEKRKNFIRNDDLTKSFSSWI